MKTQDVTRTEHTKFTKALLWACYGNKWRIWPTPLSTGQSRRAPLITSAERGRCDMLLSEGAVNQVCKLIRSNGEAPSQVMSWTVTRMPVRYSHWTIDTSDVGNYNSAISAQQSF